MAEEKLLKRNNTIEELKEVFAENVIKQNYEIEHGTARKGNVCANRYIKVWEEIQKRGDIAKEEFSTLLDHENIGVKEMAACLLLKYKHKEARKVLEEIAKGDSLIAFGAEQCLMRWEEGEWHLDD